MKTYIYITVILKHICYNYSYMELWCHNSVSSLTQAFLIDFKPNKAK